MPPINENAAKRILGAVRQAAIERIRFFQDALAERGIFARIGTELEFFPLNKKGVPQDDLLDAKQLAAALQQRVPTVERVHQETIKSVVSFSCCFGASNQNPPETNTTLKTSIPKGINMPGFASSGFVIKAAVTPSAPKVTPVNQTTINTITNICKFIFIFTIEPEPSGLMKPVILGKKEFL